MRSRYFSILHTVWEFGYLCDRNAQLHGHAIQYKGMFLILSSELGRSLLGRQLAMNECGCPKTVTRGHQSTATSHAVLTFEVNHTPSLCPPFSMTRPKKYATDEERVAARKHQKLAWFHR